MAPPPGRGCSTQSSSASSRTATTRQLQHDRPPGRRDLGAIQHQFGTRQALLLAVLEDRWHRLTDRIEAAAVSGDTLEERLGCVMTALEAHYGDPEHLVVMQIMLDLIQSPATSETTERRRRPRPGAHPRVAAAVHQGTGGGGER